MRSSYAVLALLTAWTWLATSWLSTTPAWAQAASAPLPAPHWIWSGAAGGNERVAFRREFKLEGQVKQAWLAATADNHCEVFLNGRRAVASNDWSQLATADVANRLTQGDNVLSVLARNEGGPAGLIVALRIVLADGTTRDVITDGQWKAHREPRGNWRAAGFDEQGWQAAEELGRIGAAGLPWSQSVNPDTLAESLGGGGGGEFLPQIAENATVPAGFQIEKVFHVPRSMGSWVSLTTDPQGRLIACDQGGAGLFLITPGTAGQPTKVERMPIQLSGAQGLLYAFDSLYAVVNGGPESGLHRLRDTDGDGLFDSDEYCMHVPGGGEHGPHGVVLSPDGKSLVIAAGNHTKLPEAVAGSRLPRNWNEDLLLPRRWDANGHAAGILAPGGWICEVDPSGKQWNVVSMGYRNQYDIAYNLEGELFTFDADMEWDLGSPWYRPTRVCHATSGSEFGWRSGTGKWPTYYEDSLPPTLDIGPGSPTGVVFGTGAKFPAKYQRALFILDWTYSTIYAVHLTPDGASYRGEKEDFVTGTPLPVTDAVVGADGALYFAVGGRGTQSALYRVTYVGEEATAPAVTGPDAGSELRALRHQLEAFHGRSTGDLDLIFKHLDHSDRFIRYAARVALENQPVEQWRKRALEQTQPLALVSAMIALARQGQPEDLDAVLAALQRLDYARLAPEQRLGLLRAYQLAFIRLGEPAEARRQELATRLDQVYPAATYEENAELVQLLVYLKAPSVVAKTLDMIEQLGPEPVPDWGYLVTRNAGYGGTVGQLLANMPPVRGIHFAFVLRNVKEGWTLPQRQRYFEFFVRAAQHPGGNSYGKFLMQFRDDAVATLSPAETVVLGTLASQSLLEPPVTSTPPQGPGRKWTTSDALAVLGGELKGRNHAAGRNLYHATSCSKCHRLAGEGGAIGPDLSTAGKKFSLTDLVDAITEPSKVISDQYGSHQVVLADGKVLVGRAVEIGDEVYIYTPDADAKPVVVKQDDIEQLTPSKVSQMPEGLVDTLNPEELKDLIAYLLAAGDPKAAVYKKE
jgi:putative heme-binding domain-containing protein